MIQPACSNVVEYFDSETVGFSELTNKKCDEHGPFEAKLVYVSAQYGPRYTSCPRCEERQKEERAKREAEEEKREKEERRERRISGYRERCGIPLRFAGKTLDRFECKTPYQKSIIKAVNSYLERLQNRESPCLIMCGPPGTGKTRVGCGIVDSLISHDIEARIITAAKLMRRVKATYDRDSEDSETDVLAEFAELDVLVIDEVGIQYRSDAEKLIFFEIVNMRYESRLPTVLISNLNREELAEFPGERVLDRFREGGGGILVFNWESYRK